MRCTNRSRACYCSFEEVVPVRCKMSDVRCKMSDVSRRGVVRVRCNVCFFTANLRSELTWRAKLRNIPCRRSGSCSGIGGGGAGCTGGGGAGCTGGGCAGSTLTTPGVVIIELSIQAMASRSMSIPLMVVKFFDLIEVEDSV